MIICTLKEENKEKVAWNRPFVINNYYQGPTVIKNYQGLSAASVMLVYSNFNDS